MPLNLYRRHRKECEAGHPEESRSGEFDERSKKWKRCGCLIYAAGTLAGKFGRRRTGKAKWDEAKAVAASWEAEGRWEGTAAPPATTVDMDQPRSVTIERAVKAFLAEHERNSAANTVRKYNLLLTKFTEYSAHKGYVMLDQWGPVDVREFRTSWDVAPQTANRYLSVVRSFFEFAVCNEWIDRNPGRLVKNPKGKAGAD